MSSVIKEYENLPRFPDGRIDYTDSPTAPIVACVIQYGDKVLIVKRSDKVSHYNDKWDVITGYIDNPNVSAIEHTVIELEEEIGINVDDIAEIKIKDSYTYLDKQSNKTLKVFPVKIILRSMPEIKLNEENSAFKWINPQDAKDYDGVPELASTIKNALI